MTIDSTFWSGLMGKSILQSDSQQALQEMSLPERTVSSPDVDQSSRPHGKKKSGRRKADVAAEKPKAAAPKARTRKVTQKVPEDNERLVIGRFKDALAKQKTADEANQVKKTVSSQKHILTMRIAPALPLNFGHWRSHLGKRV